PHLDSSRATRGNVQVRLSRASRSSRPRSQLHVSRNSFWRAAFRFGALKTPPCPMTAGRTLGRLSRSLSRYQESGNFISTATPMGKGPARGSTSGSFLRGSLPSLLPAAFFFSFFRSPGGSGVYSSVGNGSSSFHESLLE